MARDFSGDEHHTDGDVLSGGNVAHRLRDAAREDYDSTSLLVSDGASLGAGVGEVSAPQDLEPSSLKAL